MDEIVGVGTNFTDFDGSVDSAYMMKKHGSQFLGCDPKKN